MSSHFITLPFVLKISWLEDAALQDKHSWPTGEGWLLALERGAPACFLSADSLAQSDCTHSRKCPRPQIFSWTTLFLFLIGCIDTFDLNPGVGLLTLARLSEPCSLSFLSGIKRVPFKLWINTNIFNLKNYKILFKLPDFIHVYVYVSSFYMENLGSFLTRFEQIYLFHLIFRFQNNNINITTDKKITECRLRLLDIFVVLLRPCDRPH